MANFWKSLINKEHRPTRDEVTAVQAREVAEATRQRLERAIEYRRKEVADLMDNVLPDRKARE